MKKALLIALCFVTVSLMMVHGSFAMPDFGEIFQAVAELFENGLPTPGGAGTAVDVSLASDGESRNLYPGGQVSRTYTVRNDGGGAVYFRLIYAVQYDAESWPLLNVDFTAGSGFTEHGWQDITVSGTPYKMKVFTYTGALPAGAAAPEVEITLAMDYSITAEQLARYRSDFLQVQVLAIDPAPFTEEGYTTAVTALDMALPLDTLNPF